MDLKLFLLQRKRFFDEEVRRYQGPDPLKIRCEFISSLENFPKEDVTDIYIPLLEETLKLFMEDPKYKQDIRFIQLWLNYSITQPNPVEVYKNMHSRGLGTECALLYSSWAEQLVKNGMFSSADYVFRMGLTADLKSKNDLQKQYDEFLKEIGQRVLLGKLHCPKCGSIFKCTDEGDKHPESRSSENVLVWEWNPLKPGEKDDFTCPLAYFEEPDSTKIRMYPKEKVYFGDNEEISLEELLAAIYELRYQEEEAKQQALAESKAREEAKQKTLLEAKAREEEARRLREENNELRKKEAEKFDSINFMAVPPVQASIPVVTPKMMNFPKRQRISNSPAEVKGGSAVLINNKWPQDNSIVNNTSITVHTKEALNLVQDMWSSPAPSQIQPRHLFQNESPKDDRAPPVTGPKAIPFEIYTEDDPPQPTQKQQPFQIYDENPLPKTNSQPAKGKIPFEIYDENAPPEQEIVVSSKPVSAQKPNKVPFEIYDENEMKTPDLGVKHMPSGQKENAHSVNRVQLFADDGADLASKLQSQAVIQPMCNVNQDRNDDFSDVTCNTKAFDFVLPSSTPLAFHKQKAFNGGQKFEDTLTKVGNRTDLSVILEQSKEKYSSSSTDSLATLPKTPKSGTVYQAVPDSFDPFSGKVIEELLDMIGFPKRQHLHNYHVKQTNLPTGTKTMKLGDETYSIISEIGKGAYAKVLKATNASGTNTVALKIEKPPCRWEFYIAKEIQCRVPPKYASAFMDITVAHIYNNGSVLETQYAKYGTLINNINLFKEKMGKSLDFGMVLHFAIELVDIVEYLHKCKIIHADMKPDNIVLRELPAHNESEPCLLLIDFGRCIDMSLLPPDIKFNCVFTTEDNKCIEMKENKPWTYQIDLQGLASIFYCLLVSEYMKVQKKNDRWTLQKQLPRNVRRDLWNPIFDSLLNVNPATDLPFNFTPMREALKEAFESSMNLCLQNVKTFRNLILTK